MISVIIPAHNESSVIERCINSINCGFQCGELEIIVVCNGCKDNTAELARSIDGNIIVIETDKPSKSNALNLGDKKASGYPRFYIDADVLVPHDSIRETASILQRGDVLAAAPLMNIAYSKRKWLVKAFYKVWLKLPYCRNGMIGSGVYGLSENGRKRFDKFPSITADDGFVHMLFTPKERRR